MILRVKPSNLKGYITPYLVEDEEDFNSFSASLWVSMTLFCPELVVSGIRESSKEIRKIRQFFSSVGIVDGKRMKGVTIKGQMRGVSEDLSGYGSLIPIIVLVCATSAEPCCLSIDEATPMERELFNLSAEMAKSLGADCMMLSDVLMIKRKAKKLSGGIVDTGNDFRIAAVCALASLICDSEISVFNAESINRVYPKFWQVFRAYGGNVYLKEKMPSSAE